MSRRSLHRFAAIALSITTIGAGCSGDGGTSPSAPTVSLALVERTDDVREFGIWPVDPTGLTGDRPEIWAVEVLAVVPHDRNSFTQGLELSGGVLVESTGQYGESEIRLLDPGSGDVLASARLDDSEFGEGVTVVGSTIIQLTWREGLALVWSLDDLTPLDRFAYIGEGWGLCAEPDRLVMSDGSSTLTFRDRDDFRPLGTVDVTRGGVPVPGLNELECVDGFVLANVFRSDTIVVIEPDDGRVVAMVDASRLNLVIDRPSDDTAVLNGIARWSDDSFVLGGKLWPEMAEVRLVSS